LSRAKLLAHAECCFLRLRVFLGIEDVFDPIDKKIALSYRASRALRAGDGGSR
jgi:hypothetical protein